MSNRGPSLKTLGSAFLTLLWPHELSNGKWLLYPLQLELLAAPGLRTVCSPAANPLRLALVYGGAEGGGDGGGSQAKPCVSLSSRSHRERLRSPRSLLWSPGGCRRLLRGGGTSRW